MMRWILMLLLCAPVGFLSAGGAPEVGDVAWGRDLDAAIAGAGDGGAPVLVLFQEVPG